MPKGNQFSFSAGCVSALLVGWVFLLGPGQVGCSPGYPSCSPELKLDYIRADYQALSAESEKISGEVFASEIFQTSFSTYKTVAIRVPESCLNDTAGQKTGQSASKVILNTACGAYFSELEKSLVKSGYRVISWDRIQNSYDTAVELGADIVFMVNSLETSEAQLGDRSEAKYSYYYANGDGTIISPAALDEKARAAIMTFVNAHTEGAARVAGERLVYTSIMDVTAITASSGETVWFYNKTCYESPAKTEDARSFLFAGYEGKWWPVFPEGMEVPKPEDPGYQSQDVKSVAVSQSDLEDQNERRKLALIREVVADFVETFRTPGK